MRLNDSGGGKKAKKKNTLGITSLKGKKQKVSKSKGGSVVKKVLGWLNKPQSQMFKSSDKKKSKSSKKKKSKSIMETTTAKKNAEKEIAKVSGKTTKPNTKISSAKTKSSSKKKSESSKHKSSSSTHKTTSHKTTSTHKAKSSGKKEAVKRASGNSSKKKETKVTSSKEKAKKSTSKVSSKKSPSKESQIKSGYKKGSDAYYNNQKSLLDANKASELNDINNAYLTNLEAENANTRATNNMYDDRVGEINDNAYKQAQMTQLGAQEMGLQNSQQLLGLQAGDNFRTNNARQGALTERDRMLADINGRISTLQKTKLNDVNKTNTMYNANLRGARAEADRMYYDKSSGFDENKYTQDRQHQWDVEDREDGQKHDVDMFNRQQKASQQAQARQSAYQRAGSPSGRRTSTTSGTQGTSGLKQQANQYKQAKQTSPLSTYNKSFQNKNQSVVVRNKYPLGAPPTVADNPNLTAYQKYKMLGV